MPNPRHCFDCGARLPDTVLGGLCPACALRGALSLGEAAGLGEDPFPGEAQAPPPGAAPAGATRRTFGDYELLEEIARGGMGIVYKARQKSLNRLVALKMIRAGGLASDAEVKRFQAEAQAIAQLQHVNIVAIHEVGAVEGRQFFAMDYIEGRTLAEIVREGPLPARRAASYLKAIAEAVHWAHAHGILHRDLKPSNVLIDEHDQPRITDFGLAKRLSDHAELTLPGQVLGSPNYLSPEQAAGRHAEVGPASDVYALGAMLYHLLTGRPPFQAESLPVLLRQVMEAEPIAPRALNPSLPRDLETICLKCLEKEPSRRFASAQAMAEELGRFLERRPILARPASSPERVWRWCRRRPVRASLIAALVLVTLAGAVGVLTQWRRAELARSDAIQKLWRAYLAEAHASRWSSQPGRRFDSLAALSNAAAIRPALALRNEAIACLALPDVRVEKRFQFPAPVLMGDGLVFDDRFERYARTDLDSGVHICRVEDDRELLCFTGQGKPEAISPLFSPDGQWLAEKYPSPPTHRLRVWNLAARELVLSQPLKVQAYQFTADSRQLVALETTEAEAAIHWYDLPAHREVRKLSFPHAICDLALEPGGRRLAISPRPQPVVLLLDPDSPEPPQQLDHPAPVRGLAWSRNANWLACCCEQEIYLWNLRNIRQKPIILEGHSSVVKGVLFNRGGDLLASWGWDGMTRFWDPNLGQQLVKMPGAWVPAGFSPDDRRLGFAVTHTDLGIWQVDPARECRRFGPAGFLWSAQFSRDARLLATASREGVRLWDIRAGQLLGHLSQADCQSVIFHPDGRSLIAGGPSGVQRWPMQWNPPDAELRLASAEPLWSQRTSWTGLTPDGERLIVTGTGNADAVVLALGRPDPPRRLTGHALADVISISPDGQWFATGTWHGTDVHVWDLRTLQSVKTLPVSGNAACAFSPDGQWLLTGNAEEYRFWRAGSWEAGLAIPRHDVNEMLGSMALSPDGLMAALLIGRCSEVKLIATADGRELATLDTGKPLCFSADGTLLATAALDETSLLVWDLRAIRRHLATMKLDWDLPPMPAAAAAGSEPRNILLKYVSKP